MVEGVNPGGSDYQQDDIDLADPALREVLRVLQNVDCVGDGVEEEVGADKGEQNVLDNVELPEDGPNGADPEAVDDFPVPAVNPDPQHDELEFENGMLFEGDDYFVDVYRNIVINNRQFVFGDGVVREIVYRVHFDQTWRNIALSEALGGLLNVFQSVIDRLNENYAPSDLVRIFISNASFNAPRNIGLMPLRDLNLGIIEMYLRSILQSDEELVLDEPLEIQVAIVRNPRGGVTKRKNKLQYLFGMGDSLAKTKAVSKTRYTDNLCLARSLVVADTKARLNEAKARGDEYREKELTNKLKQLYNSKRKVQFRMALQLQESAGFESDYLPSFADIPAFEQAINARVVVFHSGVVMKPMYVGATERQRTLFLFYAKREDGTTGPGHFHAITKLDSLFAGAEFCPKCLECHDNKGRSSCKNVCRSCGRDGCKRIEGEQITCDKCNRHLNSNACFEGHVANGNCASLHRCRDCGIFYKPSSDHLCGYRKCRVCLEQVTGVHYCYIRQKLPKAVSAKYMFADFETDPTAEKHTPNLVVAHWQCKHCETVSYRENPRCSHCGSPCAQCIGEDRGLKRGGETREVCMSTPECGRRGVDFFGDGVAHDFCCFFFDKCFEGYTLIFHNGQAYDCYFLMSYILKTLTKSPSLICRGSKVVAIDTGKFRVIDSLNFLTMPLAQMPSVFGLKGIRKGTFPVFFNTRENWDYVGPMPDPSFYRYNTMKPKAREEFLAWYKEQEGKVFDFRKEIYQYCEDDVNILQESCNAFRSWLLSITSREVAVSDRAVGEGQGPGGVRKTKTVGVDPLQYNTLASVCMATFRFLFLTEEFEVETEGGQTLREFVSTDHRRFLDNSGKDVPTDEVRVKKRTFKSTPFARMPSTGFSKIDNHSDSSIVWLEYESQRLKIPIKHARNGGEHRVPSRTGGWLKLDGYHRDEISGRETAFEYMGCVFHGCPKCFPQGAGDTPVYHPHTQQPLQVLYELTQSRLRYLRSELGFEVRVMWECEFNSMMSAQENLKALRLKLDLHPRLDPRQAFYGGRTNAVKLYHEARGGTKIGYADICSLYPMVLKNDEFPVGLPRVIIAPSSVDIREYFGLVQCRVRPPRGLYHPSLPYRSNGKLMFPLCRTCADKLNTSSSCSCSDEERALEGTWTTIDLEDALDAGYEIIKVREVYHFEKRAKYDRNVPGSGLFAEYVNLFLKGKQEASGWPSSEMTDEAKADYMDEYARVEGIKLDPANIGYNSGKRATNKLLLNSFWGKFGENSNHDVTQLITTSPELFRVFGDPSKTLKDANVFASDRCLLTLSHNQGFSPEIPHVNVFIAAFTTANARRRLYRTLLGLGERVIYFDTDSVVYEYDESDSNRYIPELGNNLGQWTNELNEGEFIERFVSSGPKSYAFVTNTGRKVVKLKGQTLNHENAQKLNFVTICQLVLFWANPDDYPLPEGVEPYIEARYDRICRTKKTWSLYSREELKKFRVVYNKRCLVPNTFDTVPYGY